MSNELLIKVNADIKDFNKKLEQVQKRTEDLSESLNKAGLIAGVSFAALTAVTFKAVSEFKNANSASIMLENSLKNQGIYSDKLIESYKGMAKELGGIVNIDDDAIISGQAILQRFLGQKEITKELTLQTINLAKAQGIDLDTAFGLVGKTIAGEMNPLARQLAISIEAGATATEKMNIVTAKLKEKLDGVAEAMANAEGPLGKLEIAFGNLQENLGQQLKPAFDGIGEAIFGFTKGVEESEFAMKALAIVITTGIGLAGLTLLVVGAVKAFLALEVAAVALGTTVGVLTGGITIAAAALGALVVAMAMGGKTKTIDEAIERVKELKKQIADVQKRDPNGLALNDELRDLRAALATAEKDLAKFGAKKDEVSKSSKFKEEAAALEASVKKREEIRKQEEGDYKKRVENAKKLKEELIDAGKDEFTKLNDLRLRRISVAMGDKETLINIEKDFQDKKFKLEKETSEKINELRLAQAEYEKKLKEKTAKKIGAGASNPFSIFGMDENATDSEKQNTGIGAGVGLANSATGGKEGARQLVVAGASAGLNAVMPGLGEAAKPLLDAFSKGPEATRAMVKEFADAIPDIIQGFIEAIPVFIEEFANQLPVIIERLMEKLPEIIGSLIHSMPKVAIALALQMPRVALAFIKEIPNMIMSFIDELVSGAGRFIQALIDMINPFSGGGGSGPLTTGQGFGGGEWSAGRIGVAAATLGGSEVWNTVADVFGFAEGGQAFAKNVPSGFANDTFNAKLSSGELVVDRTTAGDVREFFSSGGHKNDAQLGLLNAILKAVSTPMNIETSVQVNQKAFADIILQLNRNNARLS